MTTATEETTATGGKQLTVEDIATGNYASIMVKCPFGLKDALGAKAKAENVSVMDLVRRTLAAAVDYTLPASTGGRRATKYATEEEKIAARKAANKKRNDLVKDLMNRYKAENAQATDGAEAASN